MMANSAQKPVHYWHVGESGAKVVWSTLGFADIEHVNSILDFGCGHGRVARHLRALFPGARMTFADVDRSGAEFCAAQFGGDALVTPKDFDKLAVPGDQDLIWLGSVFTHIDYVRMGLLFEKLFRALSPKGVLIGTFRGEQMYRTYLANPDVAARDAVLLRDYERTGIAYKRYPGWADDWGLSLVKPQHLIELGQRVPGARMIAYAEVGWASAHDVIAWTNTAPRTFIR